MALSVSWRDTPDRSVVLALHGEVDYTSAPELRAAISAAATRDPRPPAIVLDLSRVTSIDHLGVGTLVVGNRICGQVGIDLAVSNPSPLIRRLLGLARVGPADRGESGAPTALIAEAGAGPAPEWTDVSARAG